MIPIPALMSALPYIALVAGLAVSHGYMYVKGVKNTENKALIAQAAAKDAAHKVETELKNKVDMLTLEIEVERSRRTAVAKVIREKVNVYVPTLDPNCPAVDGGFRVLHNASATGTNPTPPAPGLPASAPVSPVDIATTVIDNYALANEWRAQVIGWQQWYQALKQSFEKRGE